jgi:hypothetical protein
MLLVQEGAHQRFIDADVVHEQRLQSSECRPSPSFTYADPANGRGRS